MAVEEGLGVAFISRLAAARGIALGRLVEVQVEGMELTRNLYMVRNRRQPLTRMRVEFWEFVKKARPPEGCGALRLELSESVKAG
jgi:DNA-binding transcriptional LysR family regulator